jgi:hypothetical protein
MRIVEGPFWIELSPRLMEALLEQAAVEAPERLRAEYLEERDAVSTIETVEIREASFRELDARWLERFGALHALRRAVIEDRALGEAVSGCVLLWSHEPGAQGMVVEEDGEASGVLRLRVSPSTLLSVEALRRLLETP